MCYDTPMQDTSHINALELRLFHEREYHRQETTESGKALRAVWISQIEKEIASERRFLGIPESSPELNISDEDLLAELSA